MLPSNDDFFLRLKALFGASPPPLFEYYKLASPPPSYTAPNGPALYQDDILKQASPKLAGPYSMTHPYSVSYSVSLTLSPSPGIEYRATEVRRQAPIGTWRPCSSVHARASSASIPSPQPPIGTGRGRLQGRRMAPTSPLPKTSVLGRYQTQPQHQSLHVDEQDAARFLHIKKGRVQIGDTSYERRHTADLVKENDKIILLRNPERHHTARTKAMRDSYNYHDHDHDHVRPPPPPSHAHHTHETPSTPLPLHDEPILFSALSSFMGERLFTADLVGKDDDDERVTLPPRHARQFAEYRSNVNMHSPRLANPMVLRNRDIFGIKKQYPIPTTTLDPFRWHGAAHASDGVGYVPLPPSSPPFSPLPFPAHMCASPAPSPPAHRPVDIVAPKPYLPNPNLIQHLESLIQDDDDDDSDDLESDDTDDDTDDEDVVLYMDFAHGSDHEFGSRKHHAYDYDQGVMTRGFERYAAERRLLSPSPLGLAYLQLGPEEEHEREHEHEEEEEKGDKEEKGLFDDFPVCEMSIAMGLHE
ncbi:hypothetical protein D9615_007087 [Tricholomella constricta]|uniref:Uncharacterized protein n=1 Tax=Tricholomella constricta TaxID=117010 RepID=A0A8H5H839_9AGAR|nr:hypothetical protein D9615_007087 [Tricholomella constricta]